MLIVALAIVSVVAFIYYTLDASYTLSGVKFWTTFYFCNTFVRPSYITLQWSYLKWLMYMTTKWLYVCSI